MAEAGTALLAAAFVPADTFAGARAGYCFKRGDDGLGYYPDGGAETCRATDSRLTESSSSAGVELHDEPDTAPALTVDLFDWYRNRLVKSLGGRRAPLVATDTVVVRVVSLWPHGVVGVVDANTKKYEKDESKELSSDQSDVIAIRCDVGVSVEWQAVVRLPGSETVLGSVNGRVKIASAALGANGTVAVSVPELLVGSEKSEVERERDTKRDTPQEKQRLEMEADAKKAGGDTSVREDKNEKLAQNQDPDHQPMVFADGKSLDDQAREAMVNAGGVARITKQFATVVGDCIVRAEGGFVDDVDVDGSWDSGGGPGAILGDAHEIAAAAANLRLTRDCDLPATTLAMLRPKTLDSALCDLISCHGEIGGAPSVTLARQELRPIHFLKEFLPALSLCKSSDAPKTLDLSFCGLRDAEAQQLVSVLATGSAPALTELRIAGNSHMTAVTDAMLKGLAMMRPGVTVVR